MIVGASGSGKTTIAKNIWPDELAWEPKFDAPTVIDSFAGDVEDVANALGAVGFNTVPAWLRPYHVLSNGEKFRCEIAKRILEQPGTIVVDEFTSVVDRQVAQIASHAVQKFVRKSDRQLTTRWHRSSVFGISHTRDVQTSKSFRGRSRCPIFKAWD